MSAKERKKSFLGKLASRLSEEDFASCFIQLELMVGFYLRQPNEKIFISKRLSRILINNLSLFFSGCKLIHFHFPSATSVTTRRPFTIWSHCATFSFMSTDSDKFSCFSLYSCPTWWKSDESRAIRGFWFSGRPRIHLRHNIDPKSQLSDDGHYFCRWDWWDFCTFFVFTVYAFLPLFPDWILFLKIVKTKTRIFVTYH